MRTMTWLLLRFALRIGFELAGVARGLRVGEAVLALPQRQSRGDRQVEALADDLLDRIEALFARQTGVGEYLQQFCQRGVDGESGRRLAALVGSVAALGP